jgi:hypothetical protein
MANQMATGAWKAIELTPEQIGLSELRLLCDGTAGCLVVDDFYPNTACADVVQNIERAGLARSYTGDNVEASFSGLAAIEYAGQQEEYLAAVEGANAERRRLLGGQADPLAAVLRLLGSAWRAGARIATEGTRPYFAGIIRDVRKVAHHTDSAARDLRGWAIAGDRWQLSWNLYLSAPASGGELAIWQRQWREEDEMTFRFDRTTKKGYRPEVVDGPPAVVVPPRPGRLVMFNTLYYHVVFDVTGGRPRFAMSSFVGGTDERSPLVLWS